MNNQELQSHASVEVLRQHYTPAVATAISKYLGDFMPYLSNFGTIGCSFRREEGAQSLLFLECPLFVAPITKDASTTTTTTTTTAAAAAVFPGSGAGNDDGGTRMSPFYVGVLFPSMFPSVPPFVTVMMNRYRNGNEDKWSVRKSSRVVAPNGAVQLGELSLLKGAAPPYSFLEILLALTEQFELEFPLVPTASVAVGAAETPFTHASARPTTAAAVTVATTLSDSERTEIVRRVAGSLMLHLLSKADGYLDVREQALVHLDHLYQAGGALREARVLLEERKEELLHYSPVMRNFESMIAGLVKLEDSLEEHSRCIVPEDDLQARALELLGEIHASDDALDLLERLLKAGRLSCEEYVRRVSDIGRKQFEARFLFGRVTEAVNRAAPDTGSLPPRFPPRNKFQGPTMAGSIVVPPKLDNIEALTREFPEVGQEMMKAVLNFADGDLSVARVQLKAMLS